MMRWARKHDFWIHVLAYLGPPAVLYPVMQYLYGTYSTGSVTWACIAMSVFILRFFGEDKARHDGYATGLRHARQSVAQLTKTAALYGAVRERETLRVVKEMLERLADEHENSP